MRNFFSVLLIFAGFLSFAQAPQGINYQGVARNASGAAMGSANLSVQITIAAGSTTHYQERQNVLTDTFGLYSLVIGNPTATVVQGSFIAIPWSAGGLSATIDIDAGSGYQTVSTVVLQSVPYALYANSAGNSSGGTVTSVTSGAGLTSTPNNPITTTGTIDLPTFAGVQGTHGSATTIPTFTVDNYGRITGVSTNTISVGGVAAVITSSPIVDTGIPTAPVIGITQAGTTTDGYLSSTDWNTFNNKISSVVPGTGIISSVNNGTVTINADNSNPIWNANKLLGNPISGTPVTGNVLQFTGTDWAPATIPSSLPAGAIGQMFYHDGTQWIGSTTSNLTFVGGQMGVGNAVPGAYLDVVSSIGVPAIKATNTGGVGPAILANGPVITNGLLQLGGPVIDGGSQAGANGDIFISQGPGSAPKWISPSTVLGSQPWVKNANVVSTTVSTDAVGIGTTTPAGQLDVVNTSTTSTAMNVINNGQGYGVNIQSTFNGAGSPALRVFQQAQAQAGYFSMQNNSFVVDAVYVETNGPNGSNALKAYSSTEANGVFGWNDNQSGSAIGSGVFGYSTGNGKAGTFMNQSATNPSPALEVINNGTGFSGTFIGGAGVQIDNLQVQTNLNIPFNANSGFVLTSDVAGNATWQAPGAVNVFANAPITGDGTAGNPLNMAQANAATDGYLAKGDWNTFNSKGTVSAVSATAGELTGGTITTTGTLGLANSGVTPGTYGSASSIPTFTVDAKGRITNVTTTAVTTSGTLSGGTINYVPRWLTPTSLSSTSLLFDNATSVGVNTTSPGTMLDVVANPTNAVGAFKASQANATNSAGTFTISNAANGSPALNVGTSGSGAAITANSGTGFAILSNGPLKLNNTLVDASSSAGISGQVLLSQGAGIAPIWTNASTAITNGGGWVNGGNTLTVAGTIGSNSAHNISIETGGIDRIVVRSTGEVGIGISPLSQLDLNSGNANGALRVVNSHSTAVGANFSNSTTTATGIVLKAATMGTGIVGEFINSNSGNPNNALVSTTNGGGSAVIGTNTGLGRAAFFEINTNSANTSDALYAATFGKGRAGYFEINNVTNNNAAVYAVTNGGSPAVLGTTTGSAGAGYFQINNATNNNTAFTATTNGTGQAANIGITNAGSPGTALAVNTNGTGLSGDFSGGSGLRTDKITIVNGAAPDAILLSTNTGGDASWAAPINFSMSGGATTANTGVSTTIPFGGIDFANPVGAVGGGTFTAPVTGLYHFDIAVNLNIATGLGSPQDIVLQIIVNGAVYREVVTHLMNGFSGNVQNTLSVDAMVGSGQTVRVSVGHSTGQNLSMIGGIADNYFNGHKVR